MMKILSLLLALSGLLVVGLCWKELDVHAQGGGEAPIGNGDVNGDGSIDISDAVYLLSNLFTGGPTLKPIECPPPGSKGSLPATGETSCYLNENTIAIDCENSACPGQDGFYQAGCPSNGRFVDNGDGTVTDNCTGLMWQQDTADVNGDQLSTDLDRLPWCDALSYCENLSFAGVPPRDDFVVPAVPAPRS